jgi:hypothetical protein
VPYEDREIDVEVTYCIWPGEKQTRDYPGSGPEVEIQKVESKDEVITPSMEEKMVEWILENAEGELLEAAEEGEEPDYDPVEEMERKENA